MTKKDTFSVRLDPEKRERLDRLAEAMDRSRSYLVKEAVEQYLDYHAWKLKQIREGLEAAEAGDSATQAEVFKDLRRRYEDRDEG